MNTVIAPQGRCLAAAARRDITPPVGIYHRMWGAAAHDRATGVHRPLLATALALQADEGESGERQVIIAIDHCLLWADEMRDLLVAVCRSTGLREDELQIAFSHTHGAGLMDRQRANLPGGELIGPYLDRLAELISESASEALASLEKVSIVYGVGRCGLARHRDYWDETGQQFVCGMNPSGPADDTVQIARLENGDGKTIAIVVNYACHPTTLAWENTLVSPDYVGATREVVEQATGGLCLFLQGASGDLGPQEGYAGDPDIADRNGRQLGYAVLAALEGLPKAGQVYEFAGAVVSGATLGAWRYRPLRMPEQRSQSVWRHRRITVDIPYRDGLPHREETASALARFREIESNARQSRDLELAAEYRAQAERMTRELTRIGQLPAGTHFPLPATVLRIGGGYWVFLEGEYYHYLQKALRERFAGHPLVIATVVNGWRPAYLPTRDTYGLGIYQEQVAVLAPGCLEAVVGAVGEQIQAMVYEGDANHGV
jgi:hypothetical protein